MMMIDTCYLNIKEIKAIYCDPEPLTQHANRRNKESLIVKMERAINDQLAVTSPTDAQRIVNDYLRKYLVDQGESQTTIPNIREYLFKRDFEEMILAFWRFVWNIWVPKLTAINKSVSIPDTTVIKKLSHWNGVRERALKESDLSKRQSIVQEVTAQ